MFEDVELENYMTIKISKEELQLDPFDCWTTKQSAYPHLSSIALEIMATAASTAPVERAFSYSSEATKGK